MKVLVAGWVGSSNLGDELVFAGLHRLLHARGVEVEVISQDPAATTAVHGVRAVAGSDPRAILAAAGRADALVFGGGGLLQDTTSVLNLPYHLARIVAGRARRLPFAGVGLGVGRLDTRLGRALVRGGMCGAVGITVRDEDSRRLLTEVGVPGARLGADLAFALGDPANGAGLTGDTPSGGTPGERIVVSLRAWVGGRRRLPAAARGDTTPQPYVDALAGSLDRIAADTGLTVRFVALQADRDDAFHQRVAAAMHAPTERRAPGLHELLATVADAQAVISMRYHGGIAAVLGGLPSVLIGYAPKVEALAAELGAGSQLLAWDPDALGTLPTAFAAVRDHRDAVVEARARLLDRQAGNGVLLDELLAVVGRR